MGLFFMLTLGIAALCIFVRISPWIWSIPLLAIYVLGIIFGVRHGDRVIAAEPATKGDSHALPKGA
jgi:hypothetical protein